MAETKAANLIVPEVWADMSQATFIGTIRVGGSSAVMRDNTLVGQPGDSISFPKWGALGELDELTEAVAMATTVMSQTSSKATIKEAGKAVEISDNAMLNALGDPRAEAQRQFGILAARKVDSDLIAQAQANETAAGGGSPYRYTATESALSWGVINHAIAMFGDEFDPVEFAGIFINSAQRTQVWDDPQFTNASALGGSIPVTTGTIGAIAGMPVIVTDRVTAGTFLVLKNNSLGLLYKRAPIVEYDRDILKRTNVITTNVHYAVKRLDDRGVCVGTLATP
ncbi:phage head protein [Streptomyces sp. NPDC058195]|uniref:phage major capsid protein n=1 Tax=Streptomyces sp. NPDC058195 TaxID=3346375 RepID=UPI0036F0FAFA